MPLIVPAYLVDTSVALKWVVERQEANVREARQLLEAFSRNECSLSAPDLLLLEFANALTVAHQRDPEHVQDALRLLGDTGIRMLPLRWSALHRAVDFAAAYRATVYDCYFLALAMESQATLVTADEAFLRRIRPNTYAVALRELGSRA